MRSTVTRVRRKDLFNDWGGGGRRCNKFVPVLGGDGTKIDPTADIFDKPPSGMISIWGKLADYVGDHVVLSLEGAVLVTSPGTESSYHRPPIVEQLKTQTEMANAEGMKMFAVERPGLPKDYVSFTALCGVQSLPLVFALNLPIVWGPLQW